MNKKWRKYSSWMVLLLILIFCMSINVLAEENEKDTGEQLEYTEGEDLSEKFGEPDKYVDGIYNVGKNVRTDLTGLVRLSKYNIKVQADYSTGYTYKVKKIGVKNLTLQYKSSLGLWYTITTIDNRYRENALSYMGSFTCNGTIGRTYRLKCTHYVVDNGSTKTRDNITGELKF